MMVPLALLNDRAAEKWVKTEVVFCHSTASDVAAVQSDETPHLLARVGIRAGNGAENAEITRRLL